MSGGGKIVKAFRTLSSGRYIKVVSGHRWSLRQVSLYIADLY